MRARQSVRRAVVWGTALPMTLALMAGLSWLSLDYIAQYRAQVHMEATSLSRAFANDFYAIDRMRSQEAAVSMASRMSAFPSLRYIEAVRLDGESVFRYRHPALDADLEGKVSLLQEEAVLWEQDTFFIRVPITQGASHWGHLLIIRHAESQFDVWMFVLSGCYVLFWAIMLSIYWNWWTNRRLVRPIQDMARLLDTIRLTRSFSVRSKVDQLNEFGILQRGINSVLIEIESYQQEVQEQSAALKVQQEYLRRTVQTAAIGMALYEKGCQQILSNSTFDRLLQPFQEQGTLEDLIQMAIDSDGEPELVRRPDGDSLQLIAIPTADRNGYVVTVRDITSEVKASREQEARSQSQKMEAIGRLAGSVAHDFNNLLTVILPISEVLMDELEGQEQEEDIRAIYDASCHAAELTSTLLSFTRSPQISEDVFDLAEVVRTTEHVLQLVVSGERTLVLSLSASPVWVLGSLVSLKQVLMNLIFNAVDATAQGDEIEVEVARLTLTRGDPRLGALAPGEKSILRVQDSGIGMKPETLARIFDPYFTTRASGNGLGLATVYQVVSQFQGNIHVASILGEGTTFTIVLPSVPPP